MHFTLSRAHNRHKTLHRCRVLIEYYEIRKRVTYRDISTALACTSPSSGSQSLISFTFHYLWETSLETDYSRWSRSQKVWSYAVRIWSFRIEPAPTLFSSAPNHIFHYPCHFLQPAWNPTGLFLPYEKRTSVSAVMIHDGIGTASNTTYPIRMSPKSIDDVGGVDHLRMYILYSHWIKK